MKIFLLVSVFVALPCSAQMLSPTEHRELMKRLENATFDWQRRMESLDIDKLNVSFTIGKTIQEGKDVAAKNFVLLRKLTEQQVVRDRLSADINLENSLQDVMNSFSSIVSLLPDNEQAVRWARTVPNSIDEFAPFDTALQKHILNYADHLQEQAERCSLRRY